MNATRWVCLLAVCLTAGSAEAQHRIDARLTGERVILVVPMVGTGTLEDPQRPLFVPLPGEQSKIEGFAWVPADDGKHAIVMLVARHPAAFSELLSDRRIAKAFRRGLDRQDDTEKELKKVKKDFSLEQLLGGVQ